MFLSFSDIHIEREKHKHWQRSQRVVVVFVVPRVSLDLTLARQTFRQANAFSILRTCRAFARCARNRTFDLSKFEKKSYKGKKRKGRGNQRESEERSCVSSFFFSLFSSFFISWFLSFSFTFPFTRHKRVGLERNSRTLKEKETTKDKSNKVRKRKKKRKNVKCSELWEIRFLWLFYRVLVRK